MEEKEKRRKWRQRRRKRSCLLCNDLAEGVRKVGGIWEDGCQEERKTNNREKKGKERKT